jgi:hypothetical protein
MFVVVVVVVVVVSPVVLNAGRSFFQHQPIHLFTEEK